MARVKVKYEADNGLIYRVRLDSAIAALGGAQPAGATDSPSFVAAGGSRRRSIGIRARSVRYTRNSGTTENPTIRTLRVVFLTPAAFIAAPDEVTYRTFTWQKGSLSPEDN
jgi:hypothetical protein